jgi:LacI family transcriptional regulator
VVRMQDVAAEAGVSVKTVSRVHNNDPYVAPETRQRVEAAIARLGYLPNTLARTFRHGRSAVVGVAVPDVTDPYFAAIVQEVDRTAAARGLVTVVADLGGDPAQERVRVETLLSRQLTGLVVAPVSDDHAWLEPWTRRTPVVLVDRRPAHLTADSFTTDDEAGAHEGTAHLLAHGHRAVAFLGDAADVPTTADRLVGHRRALADAGLPDRPELVAMAGATRPGVAAAVAALRTLPDPPTALLSGDARTTMALAPLLGDLGMALVSFGDFPLADALVPAVTVLDQDPTTLGRHAVERLLDRLEHPDRRFRRREVVPARLVERDSCRVPAPARA